MGHRLSRAGAIVPDHAARWLRLAIVTGPFVWLPAVALSMQFAWRFGWMAEETADDVTYWAAGICLVLWLPASPLTRLLIALVIEAARDSIKAARWMIGRLRR